VIRLSGESVSVRLVADHVHICDLISFEGPLLSLFSDGRVNWLYFWCDTNGSGTNRWMLFEIEREDLVGYLGCTMTLRSIIEKQKSHGWLLLDDKQQTQADKVDRHREMRRTTDEKFVGDYLPAVDSWFEPVLAPDIAVDRALKPETFAVPIQGDWFAQDLDRFARAYRMIYSFVYAMRPQFITTMERRLQQLLRAPWRGGYSRINMFQAFEQLVPALHALRIKSMVYNSPGDIKFEAMLDVGQAVASLTLQFERRMEEIVNPQKLIKDTLTGSKLNTRDVSKLSDSTVGLREDQLVALRERCAQIGSILGLCAEFAHLKQNSPNTIIYCKSVLAVLVQLEKLASFQEKALLDFGRQVVTP
jgi:hypothetical protein